MLYGENTGATTESRRRSVYLFGGFIAFSIGFLVYPTLEILFRGFTHISMAFCGGLGMTFFYLLSFFPLRKAEKALLGMMFILILELLFGAVFNMLLQQNVWDYSNLRIHFFGQISLFYAVLWYFMAFAFMPLGDFIHKKSKCCFHKKQAVCKP